MLHRLYFIYLFLLPVVPVFAQHHPVETGMISGMVIGEDNAGLQNAEVNILLSVEQKQLLHIFTDRDGNFFFQQLPSGYYNIAIKAAGYTPVRIDSIHVRTERSDFNLGEIRLSKTVTAMESVTVYAEKPLYENKDGKLIFNAAESALSNSASATELLKQTPLVSVDADGKLLLRGKDVKVLIDDKPMDMDARQLQELLESMPGSMIEKIEVLTTPPPQYANENGVINIITKKGRTGKSGRINVNYGTRGEAGLNISGSLRKKGLAINLSAGYSYNEYCSSAISIRENLFADSSSYFNTRSLNNSNNKRPNGRASIDYDVDKQNSISLSFIFNSSDNSGEAGTEYGNVNHLKELYRFSRRNVGTTSSSTSPSFNVSYTNKGKDPQRILRINTSLNFNDNKNLKDFYQQYLDPATYSSIADSFQQQHSYSNSHSAAIRINYDKPVSKKILLSLGTNYNYYTSHNRLLTLFMKQPEYVFVENPLLGNDFRFFQKVTAIRAALRFQFHPEFYLTAGSSEEYTVTDFTLSKDSGNFAHTYSGILPFASLVKKWKAGYSITFSYKRTIRRPGLNQLNPSIDYSDPYNLRYGNPFLRPYYAENFDLILGYWNKKYNINLSGGYNIISDIFSSIRTLQPDSKTTITWQNISGRKEYEAHFWSGISLGKKIKTNVSCSYIYNVYSSYDRVINRYRNGATLNSSVNGNCQVNPLLNATASFTFNRFSNPQGTTRNMQSMNIGLQQKFLKKNLTVSLSIVDPLRQQQNNYIVYGKGYVLQSTGTSRSRNFRIAAAYLLKKSPVRAKSAVKG